MRSSIAIITASTVVLAACAHSDAPSFGAPVKLSASTEVGTAPTLAVSPAGGVASAWVSAPDGGTDGRMYVAINDTGATEVRDSLGPIEGHGEAPPKLAYA